MTQAQIPQVLAKHLHRCELIGEGLARCERVGRPADSPYAVYYVDFRGALPENTRDLLAYEEKHIAPRYFADPRHLRWSNYLVFVVPPKLWEVATESGLRQDLERDTTFARKFVIPESDAESFFAKALTAEDAYTPLSDPTSTWLAALEEHGLDDILFAKVRSEAIESWLTSGTPPTKARANKLPDSRPHPEDGKRVAAIDWKDFRPYPTQKSFEFTSVNLISGVNGVGKTSLLEAIEAFYCGETLRNGVEPRMDVRARVGDSKNYGRLSYSLEGLKARDFRWFGAYWRRKHELARNFNRYIFFNSDSAFRLEHDDKGGFVTSALANVALGSEATDIWGRIREYRQEFMVEGERLKKRKLETDAHVASIRKQISTIQKTPLVSESQLTALRDTLRNCGWNGAPKSVEEFEKEYSSRILDVASKLKAFEDVTIGSLTIGALPEKHEALVASLNLLRQLLKDLRDKEKALRKLEREKESLDARRKFVERVSSYLRAKWFSTQTLVESASEARGEIASVVKEGVVFDQLELLDDHDGSESLLALRTSLREAIQTKRKELVGARNEAARIRRLRRSVDELAEEVRKLGAEILNREPDTTACPLCGHVHPKGSLHKLLKRSGAAQADAGNSAAKVTAAIKALENEVEVLEGKNEAVLSLIALCKRLEGEGLDEDKVTLEFVRREVARLRTELSRYETQASAAQRSLESLEGRGFSTTDLEDAWKASFKSSLPRRVDEARTREWVEEVSVELQDAIAKSTDQIADLKSTIDDIEVRIRAPYPEYPRNIELKDLVDRQAEKVQRFSDLIEELSACSSSIAPSKKTALRELWRLLEIARDIAKELVASIAVERSRHQTLTALQSQVRAFEKTSGEIGKRLDRANLAVSALGTVAQKFDLEAEVGRFIEENRERISEILRLIHAPREFKGIAPLALGDQQSRVRLLKVGSGNASVELSQISTGQRAALALSIFFTLNAKIRSAPPLVMMDDPVSYVDDLNMLALLDYLREIGVSGKRQIFFATANERLAGIFEQKFVPLGKEFRRLDLSRPAQAS